MNKVYVIQDSNKNLDPAKEYGPLTIMLRGNETLADAQRVLSGHLNQFDPDDFILLIGNPVFMSMAVLLAAHPCHEARRKLQLLVWNRETYTYNLERIYA